MDVLAGLTLRRRSPEPLYRQIAAHLQAALRAGRLAPGERLPPTRAAAAALGVNLVTVVGAYRELVRLGLASGQVGRGTFVLPPPVGNGGDGGPAAPPAVPAGEAAPPPPAPALDPLPAIPTSRAAMFLRPLGRDVIALSSGLPSSDFFPVATFRRALEAVLRRDGGAALQYHPIEGYGPLREAAAAYLAGRGIRARADDLLICSGAVNAVQIAARYLARTGDVVLVESPTYCGCLSALESLGLRLIGVPVDADGLRVDMAEALIRRHRPRALYTIPTCHNPTGVSLAAERRRALLALCQREGVAVIEEDYASEIHFAGPPPPALKAMDTAGQVIYVKSFSKVVFPAIRVALLAGPPRMVRGLLAVKEGIDPYTPGLTQRALREMMAQPGFARAVEALAGQYRPRRDALCRALRDLADRDLTWLEPRGGVHAWVRLPDGLDSQAMLGEAIRGGVAYIPGHCFVPDHGGGEFLRLSFGNATPERIRAGVARLVRVVRRQRARRRRREGEEPAGAATLV